METNAAPQKGIYAGYPRRFVKGHQTKKWGKIATTPDEVIFTKKWTVTGQPGRERKTGGGYVMLYAPNHPNTSQKGAYAEHRLVMERTLGRFLEPHERVHHKNGVRDDNRPENLELWKVTKKDPAGVRAADYHCAGCRCFDS